jgi:hypothetical protein
MNAVYALYADGPSAQRAVNGLRAAGVKDDDIVVISAQPMEEFEFSHIGHKSYMWYIACLGGLFGFASSTALAWYTQVAWAIPTGGMPIVAWWPNLIIMFELTMLGAILFSVATLNVTAKLGRRRPALYDPAVTDGKILVGIEDPAQAAQPAVQHALLVHPNITLKTI